MTLPCSSFSAISEFSEKIQQLESDRKNQTENLRRTLTEIEYAKEREDRLKKDLEVYPEYCCPMVESSV